MLYLLEETQYKVTSTDLNTAQENNKWDICNYKRKVQGKKNQV